MTVTTAITETMNKVSVTVTAPLRGQIHIGAGFLSSCHLSTTEQRQVLGTSTDANKDGRSSSMLIQSKMHYEYYSALLFAREDQ
jgi:hypothetical protein